MPLIVNQLSKIKTNIIYCFPDIKLGNGEKKLCIVLCSVNPWKMITFNNLHKDLQYIMILTDRDIDVVNNAVNPGGNFIIYCNYLYSKDPEKFKEVLKNQNRVNRLFSSFSEEETLFNNFVSNKNASQKPLNPN